jgi:hypothetical protein
MTDLYVYVFASRNKDNKDLENFKQRTMSFVSDKPLEQVKQEFDLFAEQGLDGEMSRLYESKPTSQQRNVDWFSSKFS